MNTQQNNQQIGIINLLTKLYWNGNGFLLLLMTIVSAALFSLYFKTTDVSWQNIILSVAGSILASAIFSTVQIYLSNTDFINLFTTVIQSESHQNKSEILREMRENYRLYMPLKIFEPSKTYDIGFNQDITSELNNTMDYLFKGVTGRFTAARVHSLSKNLNEVKLILINPLDKQGLSHRVGHQMNIENKDDDTDYKRIESALIEEIYLGLIGLFYSRRKCQKIEIVFQKISSIDRIEIFEGSLYITIFNHDKTGLYYFPKTIKFNKDSILYEMYKREFLREFWLSSDSKIILDSNYSENNLMEDLKKLGLINITDAILLTYKNKFLEMEKEFVSNSQIKK